MYIYIYLWLDCSPLRCSSGATRWSSATSRCAPARAARDLYLYL